MTKKRVLILAYSHLNSDPRIKNQIVALQNDYEVVCAGNSPLDSSILKYYPIRYTLKFSISRKLSRLFLFLFKRYDSYYWHESRLKFIQSLENEEFDLIIANDIGTLPLAFKIASQNTKIYFDAHEYHPKEFEDSFKWRIMHQGLTKYLCKKYIPKTDFFTTVCDSIAEEYAINYKKKPKVITNTTKFQDLSPTLVKKGGIRIIHHGAAIPSRKIENMIKMMEHVDKRFSLDLMLVGDKAYIKKLKTQAESLENVNFIPPVEQENIAKHINQYDLGIYILQPTNFNNLNALPNKIFDFIQARLGIVISPNPEMKSLVEKYAIGKVAKDYSIDSMAKLLNSITSEDVSSYKDSSHKIAKEVSSEANIEKIKQHVKQLLE